MSKIQFYEYFPDMMKNIIKWDDIYKKLLDHSQSSTYNFQGKEVVSRRTSCIYGEPEENYSNIPIFSWNENQSVKIVRDKLVEKFNIVFDYCLAHIYPDGNSGIAWHNDKEALDTSVISVSFGATRKFRFRKLNETIGYIDEFY